MTEDHHINNRLQKSKGKCREASSESIEIVQAKDVLFSRAGAGEVMRKEVTDYTVCICISKMK